MMSQRQDSIELSSQRTLPKLFRPGLNPPQHPSEPFEQENLIHRKPVPLQETSEIDARKLETEAFNEFPEGYGQVRWVPGIWAQLPIKGLLAIAFALICIAGSIAILVRSDGAPVENWRVSPTVYLALFTTGINLSARLAFKEGVKISWWLTAVRGATVRDLHYTWVFYDSFWSSIFSLRYLNLVALSSFAATFIVIDQPLIQRASTVVSVQRSHPVKVTAAIAPEIPLGYTSYQDGRGSDQQVMTQPMISAFNGYNQRTAIDTGFSGCNGSCTGYVDAGGFSANCSTISGPIIYELGDIEDSVAPFNVNFTANEATLNTSSTITMSLSYTNSSGGRDNCNGTRTERVCQLSPATLRYPVNLQGNTLTFGDILGGSEVRSLQPPPYNISDIITVDGGGEYIYWTIGGIYLAAANLFNSNATYTQGGAISIYITLPDTLSNQFLTFTDTDAENATTYRSTIPSGCAANWTDPTNSILEALNQIAFRVSLQAAEYPYRNTSKPPAPQVLTMQQTRNINVFHSEYKYLIASTVLTTLFVFLIVPTFIGWWELGRRVTLNPIETAKAFDAPLLHGPGSNAPEAELVGIFGTRDVRLGEFVMEAGHDDDGGGGKGYNGGDISMRRRKLMFMDSRDAPRPSPGQVYD